MACHTMHWHFTLTSLQSTLVSDKMRQLVLILIPVISKYLWSVLEVKTVSRLMRHGTFGGRMIHKVAKLITYLAKPSIGSINRCLGGFEFLDEVMSKEPR